jgi:hypothetical protein
MAMELRFFKKVRAVDTTRDYTILIDKSGSMSGGRWRDVCSFLIFYDVVLPWKRLLEYLHVTG